MDIVDNIRRMMAGEDLVPMHPWYRNFKGEIKLMAPNKYDTLGIAKKVDDSTIEITELPLQMWTKNYKEMLESMMVGAGEKGDGVIKVRLVRFI